MRVKISYGVELDQIPEEVQKLFDEVTNGLHSLEKQSDTIDDLLESEEIDPCISLMTKMRETLGKMDSRITDLSSILGGYSAYLKQSGAENEPSERRPVVDTTSSNVVSGPEESYGGDVEPRTEGSDLPE